eukprot:scaffold113226_cov27-Tisochrysis_lutea.AAC.1
MPQEREAGPAGRERGEEGSSRKERRRRAGEGREYFVEFICKVQSGHSAGCGRCCPSGDTCL